MDIEQKIKEGFKGRPYKFSHVKLATDKQRPEVFFICPICGKSSFVLFNEDQIQGFINEALSEHGKTHSIP